MVNPVIGVGVVSVAFIVIIANKQGTPAKIIDMAMNESGVRDTSRVLGVSVTMMIAHLKNKACQRQSSSHSSGNDAV